MATIKIDSISDAKTFVFNSGEGKLMQSPAPTEIRAARERAGLTQTQAAQLVHGTMRAWQEWESGNRKMNPGLWELFNIKINEEKK